MAPRENTDLRSRALIWAEAVRYAEGLDELVALSNNYFQTWTSTREISYLPHPCQPRPVRDLDALLAYAVEVYQCYRAKAVDYEVAQILEALLIFTEAVSLRASFLRATGAQG